MKKRWIVLMSTLGAVILVLGVTCIVLAVNGRKTRGSYGALQESHKAQVQKNEELSSQKEALSSENVQLQQKNSELEASLSSAQEQLTRQEEQFSIFKEFLTGSRLMVKAERLTLNGKNYVLCYSSSYAQGAGDPPSVLLWEESADKKQDLNPASSDKYKSYLEDYSDSIFGDFNGDGLDDIAIQGNYYSGSTPVNGKSYFKQLLPFLQKEDGSFAFDQAICDRWAQIGADSVDSYMALLTR